MMPNWCANRLRITGLPENIEKVHTLMAGGGVPAYARAISEGVQLFMAGCAGLLRSLDYDDFTPYPALSAAGPGDDSRENRAFTEWLWCLSDGVELTESTSDELHTFWLRTGVQNRTWDTLDEQARGVISSLLQKKHYDWHDHAYPGDEKMWNTLCAMDALEESMPFDMRRLQPPRLDVEINGFNGGLLKGVPRGCDYYVARYGVKWPVGLELTVNDSGAGWLVIDFDTPWSPPDASVLEALSQHFHVSIEHWCAESGESYCGYATYSCGVLADCLNSILEWDSEGEDGWSSVIGPEWILDNVAHYGG